MTVLNLSPTIDTYLVAEDANAAHDTGILLSQKNFLDMYINYITMKFNLSSIPVGATISSVRLALTVSYGDLTASLSVYRILAANSGWVSGASWNKANPSTSLNWAGSAGCNTSGTDHASSTIATYSFTSTAAGTVIYIPFDLTEFATMQAANYGFIIKAPSFSIQAIYFESSRNTHPPYLEVTYTAGGGARSQAVIIA